MLKSEVIVGRKYKARIGANVVTVRIDEVVEIAGYKAVSLYSGRHSTPAKTRWLATNLATGRQITIKSASKLRSDVTPQ